jgi:hypothetical protein
VQEANAEPPRLAIAAKNFGKAGQDVAIKFANRGDTGKRLVGRKRRVDLVWNGICLQ